MLLFKVIAMSEGLGVQLDPEFKLLEFAGPFFQKFWLERCSPRALTGKLAQGSLDMIDLAPDLPNCVPRLMGDLAQAVIAAAVKRAGLASTREVAALNKSLVALERKTKKARDVMKPLVAR
jgi:predicted unusual protein kinase regulating ubiquinone biosynthesis (AarF/ABC1/UbiB family)